MIVITAKQDGFRRCGRPHSKEPTEYQDGHWTAEQLASLKAEPMLVVTVIEEGKGAAAKPVPAAEAIKAAGECASIDDLEKLAEGETRKTVLDAIAARRAALEERGGGGE
ncbi:MAG: HI1506-related protein [Thermodesulfobacteriota bacterium]